MHSSISIEFIKMRLWNDEGMEMFPQVYSLDVTRYQWLTLLSKF